MKINLTLLKYIGLISIVMILSAGFVRVFSSGESLYDYAKKNPDLAYQKEDPASQKNEASTPPAIEEIPETKPKESISEERLYEVVSNAIEMSRKTSTDPASPINETRTSEYNDASQETNETQEENENFMTDRIIYQEGFYYEPIPMNIREKMDGVSYKANPNITYEDLRYLKVLYYDFNAETQVGELICNQAIAGDLVEIFYELYQNEYQIDKMKLIDEYNGDDTLSMEDDNTSCFNYRVVDGTTKLSKHALGLAIDINPFYNPYIVFNRPTQGETYISPKGSEIYADRSQAFPYKIDYDDLCYRLFKEHGFTWGGDWNSTKDYQHFQKAIQ